MTTHTSKLMQTALAAAAAIVSSYRAEAPAGCDPLNATLSATEISADVLDAFTTETPILSAFSTDLSSARAVKGSQIMAHIAVLPVVQQYDAVLGFGINPAGAQTLVQDVPVTMSYLPHVPTQVAYLTMIASQLDLYKEAVRYPAYVLGKNVIDTALGYANGAGGANFSNKLTASIANTDVSTIEAARSALNINHAAPMGRFAIVNTPAAQALQNDQRMMNSLFFGQKNGGGALRTFKNVGGFENIFEYADFPTNGINLSGIFGDRRAFTVATRIPDLSAFAGNAPALPQIAKWEVVTSPEGGFSILSIAWIQAGTFNINYTTTFLFGISAGNQGLGNGNATDNAGLLLATQ